MNIFSDYQKKIFNSLKDLEKKKKINIPNKIKNIILDDNKFLQIEKNLSNPLFQPKKISIVICFHYNKKRIKNLKKINPQSIEDIYKQDQLTVDFSDKMKIIDKQIKEFLKFNMYNHKKVIVNTNKGKKIVNYLFKYLLKKPKKYIKNDLFKNQQKERVIADFIAGMTDRYAFNLYKKIE